MVSGSYLVPISSASRYQPPDLTELLDARAAT
jgi:hypothetical protein